MKRKIYLALLIFLLCGCTRSIPDKLSAFISTELNKNNGVVDISKFDEIAWDRLYIIPPYANAFYYDDLVIEYDREIEATGIGSWDHKLVLLLFKEDKLVNLSDIDREVVDFGDAVRFPNDDIILFYKKDEAVFPYIVDSKGYMRIQMKK